MFVSDEKEFQLILSELHFIKNTLMLIAFKLVLPFKMVNYDRNENAFV